jgi:hypothetical protein
MVTGRNPYALRDFDSPGKERKIWLKLELNLNDVFKQAPAG